MDAESKHLYEAAMAADTAFQEALVRQYGKEAGNARYDERNCATNELLTLRAAAREARTAWLRRMDHLHATQPLPQD